MKNKKIKAFTLVELLVVLILSGVLASLVGGIFYYLFVYQQQIDRKPVAVNSMQQLDYLLKKDFDQSEKLFLEGRSLQCINKQDSVNYTFEGSAVIRQQSIVVDTFRISADPGRIEKVGNLLKSFEMEVTDKQNRKVRHRYEKIYGVATYFELNENQLK